MCKKPIEVSPDILDFLTGIHTSRDNPQPNTQPNTQRTADLLRHAFNHAYTDMSNHTIAYTEKAKPFFKGDSIEHKENRDKLKNCIIDYLCESLHWSNENDGMWDENGFIQQWGNSEDTFNKWHKLVCDKLTSSDIKKNKVMLVDKKIKSEMFFGEIICHVDKNINSIFTYGQAQKLVNMMLKYLYIYDQCEGNKSFENIVKFFHVPLDRFVFKYIFESLSNKNTSDEIQEDFKGEKYKGKPWSKIDDYETYMKCQQSIKKMLNGQNPFMWELKNWPFENGKV